MLSEMLKYCLQCPVYDMVDNVEFVGFHQTVTRSGAITVQVLQLFVWKAVVDVPCNLQRVVINLQRVVDINQ